MRATILRRIEAAERVAPPSLMPRTVFMLAGTDECRFLADLEAKYPGSAVCVVEALPSDLADDAVAAHALIAAFARHDAGKAARPGATTEFDLDATRRLAFTAARARREMLR